MFEDNGWVGKVCITPGFYFLICCACCNLISNEEKKYYTIFIYNAFLRNSFRFSIENPGKTAKEEKEKMQNMFFESLLWEKLGESIQKLYTMGKLATV